MRKGKGAWGCLIIISLSAAGVGCSQSQQCPVPTEKVAGSSGTALVFSVDPAVSARDPDLEVTSDLDPYRREVDLQHLSGTGVLRGQYVDVRTKDGNGGCEEYGASNSDNHFEYSQKDSNFQEAMAYYYGDSYQNALADAGVEVAQDPIHILAHCSREDNAYFNILRTSDGVEEERVCLGDSVRTPGAHYADDAYVIVHELQHATTSRHYSQSFWLGEFSYDEAGALNEGISDFMALMFLAPLIPSKPDSASSWFDPQTFSRWALGRFTPMQSQVRGAERCPVYDPAWPNCNSFPQFSLDDERISYVYPDGLDWKFGQYEIVREEIHNNAIIIEGTLWEIYRAFVSNYGDTNAARKLMMKLVMKTVEDLPKPDSEDLSPVTFREFGGSLLYVARAIGLTDRDMLSIQDVLVARGLIAGLTLERDWAGVGPGTTAAPGLRIEDNPALANALGESTAYNQPNGMLDPGETDMVWFDLQNISESGVTAGGVTLTVKSDDPDVSFVRDVNRGWISDSKVQIQYSKVNGRGITSGLFGKLADPPSAKVQTSYFGPGSQESFSSGIWVHVSESAPHGKIIHFTVEAQPTNGRVATVVFDAKIN